jgi:hypothetical protein
MEKKSIDKIQAFEARKKDEFKRYSDSMMAGMPNKTILVHHHHDTTLLRYMPLCPYVSRVCPYVYVIG